MKDRRREKRIEKMKSEGSFRRVFLCLWGVVVTLGLHGVKFLSICV